MYFKFKKQDIVNNVIVTYPYYELIITGSDQILNHRVDEGSRVHSESLSIHEINVDRTDEQLIYPYLYKTGDLVTIQGYPSSSFYSASYGDIITGSYTITASINFDNITDTSLIKFTSLQNIFSASLRLSRGFDYDSFKSTIDPTYGLTFIEIPREIAGSKIKKGSVVLEIYNSGSQLLSKASDEVANGELLISTNIDTGSVAGLVFYNEGLILLNNYEELSSSARWTYFGSSNKDTYMYRLIFRGVNEIPTKTFFMEAPKLCLNNSLNPTFITNSYNYYETSSDSRTFQENRFMDIANITSGAYSDQTASFEKITYISEIGLFDEQKRLIGVAKLANPVKKTEKNAYTFKLTLDC